LAEASGRLDASGIDEEEASSDVDEEEADPLWPDLAATDPPQPHPTNVSDARTSASRKEPRRDIWP
jgi:hypothetical protein